jgi:hypothetical protein
MLSSLADFFAQSVRKILIGLGNALESVVVVQLLLEASHGLRSE